MFISAQVQQVTEKSKVGGFLGRSKLSPQQREELGAINLLKKAKRSKTFCLELARDLLDPRNCQWDVPKLAITELVAAIQMTDRGASYYAYKSTCHQTWLKAREYFVQLLRFQTPMRLPQTIRHVAITRRVLKTLPKEVFRNDLGLLQNDLDRMERELSAATLPKHLRGQEIRGLPRRGRRISQHKRNIVAAVQLLNQCRHTNACKTVTDLLREHAVPSKASHVQELVDTYDAAQQTGRRVDCLLSRGELLRECLINLARLRA